MGRLAEMADLGRGAHVGVLLFAAFALANCASTDRLVSTSSPSSSSKYSAKMVEEGAQVPKGGGRYSVGKPYSINGQTYVPTEDTGYRVEGVASWYGPDFHGRQTANGEVYDMHSISAAHPTMPLPSYARVTNLDNGRSIVVRVNDRGPYARNRVIDMSIGAAKALEFYGYGLARVRVEYVGRAPLEGSDDRMLMATLRSGSPAPAPSRIMVASAAPSVFGAGGPSGQVARLPPERPFTLGMPGAGATFPGSPSIGGQIAQWARGQRHTCARVAAPSCDFGCARSRQRHAWAHERPRSVLRLSGRRRLFHHGKRAHATLSALIHGAFAC
jgi:rare lipoprotein A